MTNEMYFLGILVRDLNGPYTKKDLRRAIRKIMRLGRRPAYRKGHAQFIRFLGHVVRSMAAIKANPAESEASDDELRACPKLILSCDKKVLYEAEFEPCDVTHKIPGIRPGQYVLALDNGRVLGSWKVEKRHLERRLFDPSLPVLLAADTKDNLDLSPVSVVDTCFGGLIELRIRPGLETGQLELNVKGVKNHGNEC